MRVAKRNLCFFVGVILLLAARAADVHAEVCYAYDRLGRLVGVVDEAGRTGIYDYDSVGNILAIRRNDATSPVAITLVTPDHAGPGEQVQILGIGFSDVASNDQVTIGGVTATVLSAATCTLLVEVPSGASSSEIRVVTPFGSATASPGSFTSLLLTVSPAQFTLVVGTSRQLTATLIGSDDQRVIWSVNDVEGGNSTIGTVSPAGVYTAPVTVPSTPTVSVQARSVPFPALVAEAAVTIAATANRVAYAAPVSVNFGPPPPGTIVSAAVSVFFGIPPASVFAAPVSVANGPVIALLSPSNGAQGQTLPISVSGSNFTGATQLVFPLNGQADSAINVGSLNVNAAGDQLTATVTIALSATPGPRVVVVKTPTANSTVANTGNNVFEATGP